MNTTSTQPTNCKSLFARDYFDLRLELQSELKELKKEQKSIKQKLVKNLKKCRGVSKQRIHFAISLFKKYPTKGIVSVYDFVINDIAPAYKDNYTKHKDEIIEYIVGIQKLDQELIDYRTVKKQRIKEFKKMHGDRDFTMYNFAFGKFNVIFQNFRNMDVSIDEYRDLIDEYSFLEDVIKHYFTQEAAEIITQRNIKLENQRIKDENERICLEEINKIFNLNKSDQKTQQESEIYDIILGVFEEREKEGIES